MVPPIAGLWVLAFEGTGADVFRANGAISQNRLRVRRLCLLCLLWRRKEWKKRLWRVSDPTQISSKMSSREREDKMEAHFGVEKRVER